MSTVRAPALCASIVFVAMVLAACDGDAADNPNNAAAADDAPVDSIPERSAETSADVPEPSVGSTSEPAPARCAEPAGESHDIVVWHALGNDSEQALLELTQRFNDLPSSVTVSLERLGNYDLTMDALAAVAPADRPDAVLLDSKGLRTLVDSGATVPVDDCVAAGLLDLDGLLEVIEAAYTVDERLYAVPYNVSTPVLMYDGATFRAAGLDPATPPETLDDVRAASQQLVDSGAAPHGLIAWDGYGPWFVTQYASRRGELSGTPENGHTDRPIDRVDFATAENIASYQWLRDEVDTGRAVWIGGNPSGFDDLPRLIDREEGGAMTITTSGAIGDIARLLEAGSFDDPATGERPELGIAAMPGPGRGALVGGGAFFLLDSGDPARVGATATYLDWLAAPEQHAELASTTGFAPLRPREVDEPIVQEAWSKLPQLRVSYDLLVDLPGDFVHAGPAWGAGDDVNRVLYEAMTEVIEGGDATAVLTMATEQVNGLLAVYNRSVGG